LLRKRTQVLFHQRTLTLRTQGRFRKHPEEKNLDEGRVDVGRLQRRRMLEDNGDAGERLATSGHEAFLLPVEKKNTSDKNDDHADGRATEVHVYRQQKMLSAKTPDIQFFGDRNLTNSEVFGCPTSPAAVTCFE
jgi:hypothetical protein